MPGNVANAVVPTVGGHPLVFPQALCRAFSPSLSWPVSLNEYHDGTTQRALLAGNDRRSWKLTERLKASDAVALRTFVDTYPVTAFYFYDPKESGVGALDGSNYDATGAATQGRYKVRLGGDWQQQIGIARSDVSIELVEVA